MHIQAYLIMFDDFPSITNRIWLIKLFPDNLRNIELRHSFFVLENYIFGISSQYKRITRNLNGEESVFSITQARLDVYYYTLTWDKLKKGFERFKKLIDNFQSSSNDLPEGFKDDYRLMRTRIEHLLDEYQTSVRNEYEHPSWQPKESGNIREWGTLVTDVNGDIVVHVGKDEHAIVKKKHIELLMEQWADLIDLFIKYFTDKPLTSDLLEVKSQIDSQIDLILEEYNRLSKNDRKENADEILHKLILADVHLSRESIQLAPETKEKVYSLLENRQKNII